MMLAKSQREDLGVGPAAREAPHVSLDLDGVLAEPRGRQPPGAHLLGEHRRVARGGAVDRGGGLHDEALDRRGLLARGEQLHRADDVDLLLRSTSSGEGRRRDDVGVHDRVDVTLGDDLADHRVADVGADELGAAEIARRRDDIDSDDPVNAGVGREPPSEDSADIAGHPRHENYLAHGDCLSCRSRSITVFRARPYFPPPCDGRGWRGLSRSRPRAGRASGR